MIGENEFDYFEFDYFEQFALSGFGLADAGGALGCRAACTVGVLSGNRLCRLRTVLDTFGVRLRSVCV